jgi:hypothetical protein
MVFRPWPSWIFGPREFLEALGLGTICLIIFGIPLLLILASITFILKACGLIRWPYFVGSGACMGLGLMIVGKPGLYFSPEDYPQVTLIAACVGAICGWIHWRIAVRQTPRGTCPITTA